MCGITGFISKSNRLTREHLEAMTDSLHLRGPDAFDYYQNKARGIYLGHRRLSILDLSKDGNQPFYSTCKRYVMVYNGEIYNYEELAKKYNIQMKTSSDSEIVIESFVLLGVKCVEEFNGMFSIVIWDTQEDKMYIFRDRLGIKPLFIYQWEGTFAFASELKALKKLPLKFTTNYSAAAAFLHVGYIPQPTTIYNECFKFPAGCYGIYHDGALKVKKYWSVDQKIKKETLKNELVAEKKLENILTQSVKRRMISDVPLGTFLSGGIDSSLVSALAQNLSDKPIKAFTIGFKEAKYNEAEHASKIAKHLGLNHYKIMLSEEDALERIEGILDIYDEPFADSSAIPTLLVSEIARKEVTVCLSGDGGDELFMGYGMYDWAKRLNNPILSSFRKPLSWGLRTFGNDRFKRGASVLDFPDTTSLKSHLFSQEQGFFSRQEISRILTREVVINIDELIKSQRILDPMECQSIYDIKNYLKDDLLVKVDRASMFHSLEVRVPLLDHNLVEFAINLDVSLKNKAGIKKYLLKQILYNYLPKSFFKRPKWGFGVPLEKWLVAYPDLFLERFFNKRVFDRYGIVNYESVKHYKRKLYDNLNPSLKGKIWSLILLHWYLEKME